MTTVIAGGTALGGDTFAVRRLGADEASLAAATALAAGCSIADRIRRAGSADPGLAARWLLPRGPADVAVAAVRAGELIGVANANAATADAAGFEVAVIVAPAWRRRGVAATLLRAVTAMLPIGATVTGQIRSDDPAGVGLLHRLAPDAAVVRDVDTLEFTVPRPAGGAAAERLTHVA